MTPEKPTTCAYPGCDQHAIDLATDGRDYKPTKVEWYCSDHSYTVANTDSPEYIAKCPNCGCYFGVN